MKKVICWLILLSNVSFGQSTKPYAIGEVHKLASKFLNEERRLNVHLPHNFSQDSIYPVLYILDGSANEDFLHIVGLVQFFQLQFGMPEFIVVGIENVDRKRDFTFHTDDPELAKELPTAGHSAEFIQFLETEMKPFVEKRYKTNGENFLIGQSLGGLLATEILLTKPQLFSHYFIVSPSLWWDNNSLLKKAIEFSTVNIKTPVYVSISVGGKEHKIMKRDARKLRSSLRKNKHIELKYNKLKKENHATILHNALYTAFQELYPFQGRKW